MFYGFYMVELRALIFDIDGTLADTERYGHRVAFNLAFAEAGLDWHWSEDLYAELLAVTGGKERIRFFVGRDSPSLPEAIAHRLQSSDVATDPNPQLNEWIAELHQAKNHHYAQLIRAHKIPPRPGVVRLIQDARDAGLRLAIATTSAYDNAIALIETIFAPDSPSWFEVIAAGDIVPHKKPAPDIYQSVLQELSLDAEECLAFEDSEHGLQSATQAGLATIVTRNDYTWDQNFSEAVLVLDHLGEPDHSIDLGAQNLVVRNRAALSMAVPLTHVTVPLLRWCHRLQQHSR